MSRGAALNRVKYQATQMHLIGDAVTNPPFKLSVPFVRHSLDLGATKVAMLLKIAFLEGVERAALFRSSWDREHSGPPQLGWL